MEMVVMAITVLHLGLLLTEAVAVLLMEMREHTVDLVVVQI